MKIHVDKTKVVKFLRFSNEVCIEIENYDVKIVKNFRHLSAFFITMAGDIREIKTETGMVK